MDVSTKFLEYLSDSTLHLLIAIAIDPKKKQKQKVMDENKPHKERLHQAVASDAL